MARITVEDCLTKLDNQYDLVLLAKERTTQLNSGSPMLVEEDYIFKRNWRWKSYNQGSKKKCDYKTKKRARSC